MISVSLYIMAGGVGSRFWPKSRNSFPKQFIDILGIGKSLLQMTVERFDDLVDINEINIITNYEYFEIVKTQLPYFNVDNILQEPSRKNTAPCIAYAAFKLFQKNPEAVMIIVPSDHLILNEIVFKNYIKQAVAFASNSNVLITLGIKPTRPDTGYGYIQYDFRGNSSTGVNKVLSFKEKPNIKEAIEYLSSGHYLWNSGMFVWSAAAIVAAFKENSTDIYGLFESGKYAYNTDMESSIIQEIYQKSPNISIDFAIMEKADNVYTIPVDIGWSDLGTWNSLHEVFKLNDAFNNVSILKNRDLRNSKDCLVSASNDKLVIVNGLKNYIIVDEEDVLLIYPMDKEQGLKEITMQLKKDGFLEFL